MAVDLEAHINGAPFNIHHVVSKAFFKAICLTILEEVVEDGFSADEMEE